MFRPILFFLLFVTVLTAVISKSLNSADEILLCYDTMATQDVASAITNSRSKPFKRDLCIKERESIYLYDLCFRQVDIIYAKESIFNKIGYMLADTMRSAMETPYQFAQKHNNACSVFPELYIEDIKPVL